MVFCHFEKCHYYTMFRSSTIPIGNSKSDDDGLRGCGFSKFHIFFVPFEMFQTVAREWYPLLSAIFGAGFSSGGAQREVQVSCDQFRGNGALS